MAEFKDPKRLFEADDAPLALRDWLSHARGDALSAEAVEELVREVESMAQQAPQPEFPKLRRIEGTRVSQGVSASKGVLLVLGVGIGAALLWTLSRPGSEAVHSVAAPMALTTSVVSEPAPPPPAPSAPPSSPATKSEEAPAPTAPQPSGGRAKRLQVPAVAPASQAHAAPVAREFELVRDARAAVASAPGRALELTKQHEREFPSGMLTQEREAIAIESLQRLNRRAEAHARAERFLARFPASPYRARIEAARASNP